MHAKLIAPRGSPQIAACPPGRPPQDDSQNIVSVIFRGIPSKLSVSDEQTNDPSYQVH